MIPASSLSRRVAAAPSTRLAPFALAALLGAGGCDGEGSQAKPEPATGATGATTVQAAPAIAAKTPAQAAPAQAAPAQAAPAAPTGGRSKPPTLEEWNAQTREVTVTGSSALNCETKQVREWVRISRRGEPKPVGKPQSVKVVRGKTLETFEFSAPGTVASLVFPFEPGLDLEARFDWENGTRMFSSQWPRGAPEPPARGAFR